MSAPFAGMTRIRFDGCDLSRGYGTPVPKPYRVRMLRLPPALASRSTARILELLGDPPGTESDRRVLELGFAGIHARPLELAGWEVVVVEPDPAFRGQALERGGRLVDAPEGRFRAVVVPAGADVREVDAALVLVVERDGSVSVAGETSAA
jgi:hypothetical protein